MCTCFANSLSKIVDYNCGGRLQFLKKAFESLPVFKNAILFPRSAIIFVKGLNPSFKEVNEAVETPRDKAYVLSSVGRFSSRI